MCLHLLCDIHVGLRIKWIGTVGIVGTGLCTSLLMNLQSQCCSIAFANSIVEYL